jgi:hypothetical protein
MRLFENQIKLLNFNDKWSCRENCLKKFFCFEPEKLLRL